MVMPERLPTPLPAAPEGHASTASAARHEWRGGQWLPSTSGAMEIHKTRRGPARPGSNCPGDSLKRRTAN